MPPLLVRARPLVAGALFVAALRAPAQGAPPSPAPAMGAVVFPNSGSPAAQPAFIQGVLALHSFMYDDAAAAFREAQRLDPNFALAFWGEAMTYDHALWEEHDRARGRAALVRLAVTPSERLAKARTPREQGYFRAAEVLFFGPEDARARDAAYAGAMARLHEMHPDDDEATIFYALALLGQHGMSDTDREDANEAARLAERVLTHNPRHPGAAHIVIHAYDHPEHARKGLAAARAYSEIAPAAHHALHMPSHIFVQLGMWNDVVAANERSYAASVAWAAARGFPATRRDHHSLSWLQYGYLQQGRFAKAREALDSADAAARTGAFPRGNPVAFMRAQYALETRQRTPLALPAEVVEQGGAACTQPSPGRAPIAIYASGVIAARTRESATAEAAWDCLRVMADSARGDDGRMLRIATAQLGALIALGERREEDALRLIAQAATAEDSLVPYGPGGFLPSHELYGEVLLILSRPREAAEQFDLALRGTPNRASSLLGRARAAKLMRDSRGAVKFYEALSAQWKHADPEVPELTEVLREASS